MKGRPCCCVKQNSDDVKASVRPVGPWKVMGWPEKMLYSIPESPHDTKNSFTPIDPFVMMFVRPPNATIK